MQIVLFDIDGTLINTRGSGLAALNLAFAEVFARPVSAEIATVGRTDRGIARDFFLFHHLEDSAENWLQFRTAYLRHLAAQLPQRGGCLLPGVVALLQHLLLRQDVAVGLLTGNTQEGSRLKLEHFGINHHFRFGGFGDCHPERNAVAREALAAAQAFLGRPLSGERTWVVGDTPLDIECARHIGAQAVAVATGFHRPDQLASHSPDYLFDDLSQAGVWLEQLERGSSPAK